MAEINPVFRHVTAVIEGRFSTKVSLPRGFCAVLGSCWLVVAAITSSHAQQPSGVEASELRNSAVSLEHGEGVQKNPARAAALYCEAARLGDVESAFSLGWMLANGRGVSRDDRQAAFFFSLAARQDHPQATRMLRQVGPVPDEVPPCMRPPEPAAAAPDSDLVETLLANTPAERRKLAVLLAKLAPEYGVEPALALAIARNESNLNPDAVSPKNAQGLMQLIPETSVRFNVTKPFDPEQNIRGGLSYIRWLLAYFRGSVPLVVAAYNAGEGAVNRHKGIPPYAETRDYVKRILGTYKRVEHPFDARVTEPSPELPRIRRALTQTTM